MPGHDTKYHHCPNCGTLTGVYTSKKRRYCRAHYLKCSRCDTKWVVKTPLLPGEAGASNKSERNTNTTQQQDVPTPQMARLILLWVKEAMRDSEN